MQNNNRKFNKSAVASIPVQSRVDVRRLAEMVVYFENNEIDIRSMSQLLSWTVEVAVKILKTNNLMPTEINSVYDANDVLELRELYQPGMYKRAKQKMITSMKFENLVDAGIDPKDAAPGEFNVTHNNHSIKTMDDEVSQEQLLYNNKLRNAIAETKRKIREEESDKLTESINNQRKLANQSGSIVNIEENIAKMNANDKSLEGM